MRSIKARFTEQEKRQPCWGAFICLAEAVKTRGFSRKCLVPAFKKLIPRDEYERSDTKALIDHLYLLTNKRVAGDFSSENRSRRE
ncbi:MAG: hypothetical protein WCG55_04075 [bacterium]